MSKQIRKRQEQIAVTYEELQSDLYADLEEEFKKISINGTLS